MGISMKSYVTRQSLGNVLFLFSENQTKMYSVYSFIVPDSLLMQLIRERLSQKDCITKGWIMIGFPRTREQAESLARISNMIPNR